MTFYDLCLKNITELIRVKTLLQKYYHQKDDKKNEQPITFKLRNYKKWLNSIKNSKEQLINVNNPEDLTNIEELKSKSLQTKLKEILETKNLKDIDDTKKILKDLGVDFSNKSNSNDKESTIFENAKNLQLIHGFGEKKSLDCAKSGLTLDILLDEWKQFCKKKKENNILLFEKIKPIPNDVVDDKIYASYYQQADKILQNRLKDTKNLKNLNYDQLIGLKYFNEIQKRIPRDEIVISEKTLITVAKNMDKNIVINVCGSYRRGKSTSGDIDVLISHKKIHTNEDIDNNINILQCFVRNLTKLNLLVDHINKYSQIHKKYMGMFKCKISECARRIDIKYIPYDSLGASLLHFTGSKNFNTQLRRHALKKGFTLNEYGLINKETKEFIPSSNEENIFKLLDYKYHSPEERDI